jgi:flagellar hook-length control protein FliK
MRNAKENIMNNLPMITNTPQNTAKPASAPIAAAQTSKPASPVQSAKPVEGNSSEGKSFGDVLARQVSDSTPVEEKSQPESTPKTSQAAPASKSSDDDSTQTAALVTGLAVQGTDAIPAEDASTPKKATSKVDQIFDHIKARNTAEKIAATPNDANTNLPPGALAALVPVALAATTPAEKSELTKKSALPGSSPNNITGLNLDQVAGNQELPAAKNATQSSSTPALGAKKDANFTNMMDTITASTSAKLMGNDDKAAALAAAPQANANTQATLLAATAPIAVATVMPTQVTINTPVSHENWGEEFNEKITWLSNQKEQTAELHLNPPQLGPMDVVIKVSGDQATALFTSPHAAVREAVEQALPRLREMMAESGIMLGNATVSDQAPRGRQGDGDNKSSSARSGIGGVSEASRATNQTVRVSPISRHNGIVDTFA